MTQTRRLEKEKGAREQMTQIKGNSFHLKKKMKKNEEPGDEKGKKHFV